MARSLLLTLPAATAASWPQTKKPDFLTIDFVVNFIDGLTNDQHDLQTCILGSLQPIGDLVTAVTEGEKAIHDRKDCPEVALVEFVKAYDALEDFLHDVKPAYAGCMAPVKDVKADIAVLKSFPSIKDLMQHVEDDFAKDEDDKIMSGFEEAFRAYFQKDYGAFGGDLGTALYRMMISPKYPDEMTTTPAPTQLGSSFPHPSWPHPKKPAFLTIDFVVNFLDGLTNDNHDLQQCILGSLQPIGDAVSAVTDGKAAIHDRSILKFIKAIEDVRSLLKDVPVAEQGCEAPIADVKLDLSKLADVKSFGDLIRHVEADVWADEQCNILTEFEAAFQAYFKKDYGSFGTDLGTALYRLLISPKYPDEKVVV